MPPPPERGRVRTGPHQPQRFGFDGCARARTRRLRARPARHADRHGLPPRKRTVGTCTTAAFRDDLERPYAGVASRLRVDPALEDPRGGSSSDVKDLGSSGNRRPRRKVSLEGDRVNPVCWEKFQILEGTAQVTANKGFIGFSRERSAAVQTLLKGCQREHAVRDGRSRSHRLHPVPHEPEDLVHLGGAVRHQSHRRGGRVEDPSTERDLVRPAREAELVRSRDRFVRREETRRVGDAKENSLQPRKIDGGPFR